MPPKNAPQYESGNTSAADVSSQLPTGRPYGQSQSRDGTGSLDHVPHFDNPTTASTRSLLSEGGERIYGNPTSARSSICSIPRVKILAFRGDNVSQFLQKYELEFKSRGHGGEGMAENLPLYVKPSYFKMVREMQGWEERDWTTLKRSMRDTFVDEELFKYCLADLRRFVSRQKKKGKPDKLSKISKVYFKFAEISSYLKKKGTISGQEESRYFLSILPDDIVDTIYARRDTRQLVRAQGELVDEDEGGALPDIKDVIKELRSIFASFAKRGKTSKIRGKRQWGSSDSESDLSEDSDASDSESSSDEEKTHKSKWARSSSRSAKSSKSSESERSTTRMKMPSGKKEHERGESDLSMKDLLAKFTQLQVTMAQLATNQSQTSTTASGSAPYAPRRNSFSSPTSPSTPGFQNRYAGRWSGAAKKDAPPHEANTAAYESNFVASGSNSTPVGGGMSANQWGKRPETPTPTYQPRPPPLCLWCAGEDGEPHWMSSCADMQGAVVSGVIRRDNEGKARYGMRYIPSRAHPRGMRGWVKEQEALAKAGVKEQNVRFTEVKVNSIEYEPPSVSEGTGEYEAMNVRVDEFEVNQVKRPRSASPDTIPQKKATRTSKPRTSQFEEMGYGRGAASGTERDEEMTDAPRKRQPRAKLASAMEAKSDPREYLQEFLKQPVTLPMNLMLANSPELTKLMLNEFKRKRTPLDDEPQVNNLGWDNGEEIRVNNQALGKTSRKAYYAGVLAFTNITVEGESIKALLDNGSMICMMQDSLRRKLGLPIRTDGTHRVRMAGGGTETLMGISEGVPVKIGGVTTHVHFFISKDCSNPILLGQNFLRQVRANFEYNADGSVIMGITHKGRRLTVEVTSSDESRYLAHVPGESRDFDSAMVSLVAEEKLSSPSPACEMCKMSDRQCADSEGRSWCTARRSVLRPSIPPPTKEKFLLGMRVTSHGVKVPVFGEREDTPEPESGDEVEMSGEIDWDESLVAQRVRKIGKNQGKGMGRRAPPEKTWTYQKPSTRSNRGSHMTPEEVEHQRMHQQSVCERRVQRNLAKKEKKKKERELTESQTLGEKFDEDAESALLNLDRALRNRQSNEAELNNLFPGRSSPWLVSCTTEEAEERARILKEEYDRFLHVLFGRNLPLMRNDEKKRKGNSPSTSTIFRPLSAREECSGMMFPRTPLIQPQDFQPFEASVTPQDTLMENGGEGERLGDVPISETIEEPAFDFNEWLTGNLGGEGEPTSANHPQPADQAFFVGGDLSVESTYESTLPPLTAEELVKELGLQLEGTELASNFVEWTDAEDWAEAYEWDGESAATSDDEMESAFDETEMEMGWELATNMVEWGTFSSDSSGSWDGEEGESSDTSGPPELIEVTDSESEEEGNDDEKMRDVDEMPDGRGAYASDMETDFSGIAKDGPEENESESRARSKEGSKSGEEERIELKAYRLGSKSSSNENDEVSEWWRRTKGNDEKGEGLALSDPWYSWKLWDRRRKFEDFHPENSESKRKAEESDENTYQNSQYQSRRETSRAGSWKRSQHGDGDVEMRSASPSEDSHPKRRLPKCDWPESEASSSDKPCGQKGSDKPCRSKTSDEPWPRKDSTYEVYAARKRLNRVVESDLHEAFSLGTGVREGLGVKRVVAPKGSLTPGEILGLKRIGVQIAWEGEEASEEELEPVKKKVKAWRKDIPEKAKPDATDENEDDPMGGSESDSSSVTHISDSEDGADITLSHRNTYMYKVGTMELLEKGFTPEQQEGLAKAVLAGDLGKYEELVFEVNTKYKPVGKKINPIPIALPTDQNPPLKRPPLSRDPYLTPLLPNMPKFEAGGKLTEERLALMDFGPEGWLTSEERNLILNVLRLREKALAFDGMERGKLKETYADPYVIPVVPHTPWRQSALPIPLAAREKIIETFKKRMEEGLYEKSTSAYSGRWFVVAKKDGNYRIVHDLQPLNAVTIRDAGLPPVMEDFIEDFTGRACLGLMDVLGGFDQRVLALISRDLTTFMTPLGPVRLTRLPQGATNSVAEFQRAMVHILAEEIPEFAGVFVDDVGIKGPKSTYNNEKIAGNSEIRRFVWEYAVTLERILFRFEEAGITGSGPKAAAIVPSLNIVGTIVSMEGRKVSSSTKNKVSKFPTPQDVSEVRGFLGICTYVRIWIKGFADIAAPLRNLTRKDKEFVWSVECQQSFDVLKKMVGEDILLKKLDYGVGAGKIILAVDSSHIAAGGIIFQEDSDGKRRPARYESLTFTATESRYSQPKLELAGVAKMLKKLQMYLWGQHFTLEVDASALVQMINAPELPNAPMNRWLRFIQLFDFDIVHIPGKKHTLADGLSRARRDEFDEGARDLDSLISAHVRLIEEKPIHDWRASFVEKDYESDPGVLAIGKYLSNFERPPKLTYTQWVKFQNRARNFALEGGKLYRRRGGMFREVVLDKTRQLVFLKGVHDDTGHRGREETARRVSERAWWPGWSATVKTYVKTCDKCQERKPNQERESRKPSMSAGFFRKFNFDVTHIKEGTRPYLLTCREDLTGWVEGIALPNITSLSVSKFISEKIIPRFGWFYQATVDGGAEFKGEVIEALKDFDIKRIVIAPYHPEANGMEERGHQPLVDCLVKISDSPKTWAKHLPMVLFADRISVRRTTGMTPFAMVYGTEAVLPIDRGEETWLVSDWRDEHYSRADLLKARFDQLQRKSDLLIEATEKLRKSRLASVLHHDRVNAHRLRKALEPGALILVHTAVLDTLKGQKFLPRWTGPYRVRQRLTKGSYLLEELDGTAMKKVYAARRVRRYYPRGREENEVSKEELTDEEIEEEVESDGEDVAMEDLRDGERDFDERLAVEKEKEGAYEERKPIFDLPDEENRSVQEEEPMAQVERLTEESESNQDSQSTEDDEGRPVRDRRTPEWMVKEGWDLRGVKKGQQSKAKEQKAKEKGKQKEARSETDEGRDAESSEEENAHAYGTRARMKPAEASQEESNESPAEETEEEEEVQDLPVKLKSAAKRGRGRPPKVMRDEPEDVAPAKRGPGRPRKTPLASGSGAPKHIKDLPAKRGRGRPKKAVAR